MVLNYLALEDPAGPVAQPHQMSKFFWKASFESKHPRSYLQIFVGLVRTIQDWPSAIYNTSTIIQVVRDRLSVLEQEFPSTSPNVCESVWIYQCTCVHCVCVRVYAKLLHPQSERKCVGEDDGWGGSQTPISVSWIYICVYGRVRPFIDRLRALPSPRHTSVHISLLCVRDALYAKKEYISKTIKIVNCGFAVSD